MEARRVSLAVVSCLLLGGCLVADGGGDGKPGDRFRGSQPSTSGAGGSTGSGTGGSTGTGTGGSTGSGTGGAGGGNPGAGGVACAGRADTTSNFKVAWTIETATGAASTCDGVAGLAMDLDVQNASTGVLYHGVFACTAMAAATCTLPPGSYTFAMRLRDGKGTVISELAPPDRLTVQAGQTTDLGSIPFGASQGMTGPGQGLSLSWTIDRAGANLSCAQAAAVYVEVTVGTQKTPFRCTEGSGITPPIAPGVYPVTIRLLDSTGVVLSVTQTMDVAIPAGKLVELGGVPFEVL